MNQQAFANLTGIATASLSNIFSGRTRPTLMHVEALMNSIPDLNLQWLLSGTGEMHGNQGATGVTTSDSTSTNAPSLFDDAETMQGNGAAQPSQSHAGMSSVTQGRQGYGADKMAEQQSFYEAEKRMLNIGQNFHSPQNVSIKAAPVSRKITEIRVYFDDQTWESFVPKK